MQGALTRRREGFTLVEMIFTTVILGVISVTLGLFIVPAINAHRDVARRALLVDAAESALRRMSRDIRISVPNSVRISASCGTGCASGFSLELIPTVDGARYCSISVADCSDLLTIGSADSAFDVLGCFRDGGFLGASGNSTYRLVVGNTGSQAYTATTQSDVMTKAGTNISLTIVPGGGAGTCGSASGTPNSYNRHHIALSASQTFPTASPRQRVFVVQDAAAPVTYICNTTAGTLMRYAGYRNGTAYSTAAQPTDPTAAPLSGTGAMVAGNVYACSATSTTADVQSKSVITLTLGLRDSTVTTETVQLLNQVLLDNSI